MNEQARKAVSGINIFPKEHVWIAAGVKESSWSSDKLKMNYVHRPVNEEDKQRRALILELLSRDTPADAKAQIRDALALMPWPCNE